MSPPLTNIVILTGAGISAESGLPTFRDSGGLWEGVDPFEVASAEAYARDPWRVNEFFNLRRKALQSAAPNAAHTAIARLQKAKGFSCYLVTQNIDNLHERGGSPETHHIHGELLKRHCHACGHVCDIEGNITQDTECSGCGRTGVARPHVVLFGEIPLDFDAAAEAASQADLFLSIGTSGAVYPAANLVRVAAEAGAVTVEVNLEITAVGFFDLCRKGPATVCVPEVIDEILAGTLGL